MMLVTIAFLILACVSFGSGYFLGKSNSDKVASAQSEESEFLVKKLKSEKESYKLRYDALVTTRYNLGGKVIEIFTVEQSGKWFAKMRVVK